MLLIWLCLWVALAPASLAADGHPGSTVAIVYNEKVPESQSIAAYYAQRRQVPTNQILGLDLPSGESMSRADYVQRLQNPLKAFLEKEQLFRLEPEGDGRRLKASTIRYLVLCYGVPIKIEKDPEWEEPEAQKVQAELQRNEASVDSQLAVLPRTFQSRVPWVGFVPNNAFNATNQAQLHPTNGLLMVSRLDGPSPVVARRLVDKAMQAETNGLWGRGYFDWRSTTNKALQVGDIWIRNAEILTRQFGMDTIRDTNEATFGAGLPMSHVALYAGWYDWNASGPFLQPRIEFMPGAFAYHLHSFSAGTLRSKDAHWVGPLLDRGATVTMGNVYEPYLGFTPNLQVFFSRFLQGQFSFGEAAWSSINALSWQSLVVGDPLYRPYRLGLEQLQKDLVQRRSALADWTYVLMANRMLNRQVPLDAVINDLEKLPALRRSAVLTEKLGDLYALKKKLSFAIYTFEDALKRQPSNGQRQGLLLKLARLRTYYGPDKTALALYQTLLKDFPEYPDKLAIYRKMKPLAESVKDEAQLETIRAAIRKLSPPEK